MQRINVRSVLVISLLVAAVGVLVEFLTGVPGFPPIPPGPFILGGTALVVALVRWRWIVGLGLAVALFIAGGTVIAGLTFQILATPSVVGQWIGAVLQVGGLLAAIIAGVAALRADGRRRDDQPHVARQWAGATPTWRLNADASENSEP